MRQTVYLDVLLSVNFFINYFLILSTGKIMRCETKRINACIAALAGSVSALSIFLPPMNVLLSTLYKLAVSGVMVFITFGRKNIRIFAKYLAVMCAVTFGFGGAMMALWLAYAPSGMYYHNGVTYFNVSPVFIIVVTIVCYSLITLAGRICTSRERKNKRYRVRVNVGDKTVVLQLMADTGNSLTEPFSGYPVIVVKRSSAEPILPDGFDGFGKEEMCKGGKKSPPKLRVIPYSSVGGEGLLTAFIPESTVWMINDEKSVKLKCCIAVSENLEVGECDGIIDPSVMTEQSEIF